MQTQLRDTKPEAMSKRKQAATQEINNFFFFFFILLKGNFWRPLAAIMKVFSNSKVILSFNYSFLSDYRSQSHKIGVL